MAITNFSNVQALCIMSGKETNIRINFDSTDYIHRRF